MTARPEPISAVEGVVAPLYRANIDTDQIMPKQFLKRVERSGFGPYIFHNWRQREDFILDAPVYADARVLVAGPNFGCGSSREQAVWGLLDAGIAAVVAPSFAPIFRGNAARARLLTVVLSESDCRQLADEAMASPGIQVHIDLVTQRIQLPDGARDFELDERTRASFVDGVDEIVRTLGLESAITAYERCRPVWLPTTPTPSA